MTNAVWANDYKVGTAPPLNPMYTQGRFGLITFQNNLGAPDATFDNFCATAAPPPVSITPNGANVDISWSANQEGIWVLDSSQPSGPVPLDGDSLQRADFLRRRLTYTAPMAEMGFFRLRSVWVVQ